jgi:hypothetical protein
MGTQSSFAPTTLFAPSSQVPSFTSAPGMMPSFGASQLPAPNLSNPFQPNSSSVRGRKILKPVRRLNR